jgi:AraC-like DNA-binding protein
VSPDVLSEVLGSIRVNRATFFDVQPSARNAEPSIFGQSALREGLRSIMSRGERLIVCHAVMEGRCLASTPGEEPIAIEPGDFIISACGDPPTLSVGPGMPTAARMICGFLACDTQRLIPLLDSLPRLIRIRAAEGDSVTWLGQIIRLARDASVHGHGGGENVIARLGELLLLGLMCRHLESMTLTQIGWLAGLRDPLVGKALACLHRRPGHAWTTEALAREVGTSRSVLATRFVELLGMPPILYLTCWRMRMACDLLGGTTANIATVAIRIGYQSDAAFSRAFRKMLGVSPSRWRARQERREVVSSFS